MTEYIRLYRDKYVKRLKRKQPGDWLPIYRKTDAGYTEMVCEMEAKRIEKAGR